MAPSLLDVQHLDLNYTISKYGIFTHREGEAVTRYWWVASGLLHGRGTHYTMNHFNDFENITHHEVKKA